MNKFISSKLFLTVEHAAKVAGFLAVSVFLSELLNQLSHSSLNATELMVVNLVLVSVIKYVNLKKTEVDLQPIEPVKVVEEVPSV